jgi:hypothetical protein
LRNPEKYLCIFYFTDGAREPAHISSRPIEPGTPALKFRPATFFWIESFRPEKFSARNLKNQNIFRSKIENSKNFYRESWKKGYEYGRHLTSPL